MRKILLGGKKYVDETFRLDMGSSHPILYNKMKVVVVIGTNRGGFQYKCTCDGVELSSRPESHNEEIQSFAFAKKMASSVTYAWIFPETKELCSLQHNHGNGKRSLRIGKDVVFKERKILDNGSSHNFVFNGKDVLITIKPNMLSFKYSMTVDGKQIPHHLDQVKAVPKKYTFTVSNATIEGMNLEKKILYQLDVCDEGVCIGSNQVSE